MNANLLPRTGMPATHRAARNAHAFAGVFDDSEPGEPRDERAWLLYDAACPFCVRLAHRLAPALCSRGVEITALQMPWVRELLAERGQPLLSEIRFYTASGRLVGGADALFAAAARFWWLLPVRAVAGVPGVKALLRRGYAFVASHRHCLARAPRTERKGFA
jgi:predicted DCC family thiol-disulfide oxidoreductase YuxK